MADVKRVERPLSPHLQIYRPQLTAVTSILTRITGNALIVAEMGGRDAFTPPPGFSLVDERRYGKARIVFLQRDA